MALNDKKQVYYDIYMSEWLSEISPVPSNAPTGFVGKSLCGSADLEVGWLEARRVIYDHELILIERGEFEVELEEASVQLRENSYLIVPPGQWHTTHCRVQGRRHYAHFDWEYWPARAESPVMTFYPAKVQAACLRPAPKALPQKVLWGTIEEPERVFGLMDRLKSMLFAQNRHEHIAARGVLLELLVRLLDEARRAEKRTHRCEDLAYRVRSALDLMISVPSSEQSVCETLRALGYSYEHLARVFRQQYGITPVAYLHSVRVERAKRLLKQGELKVEAIASEVGYEDVVYFSRLFKRHTGTSPARYRHR